MYHMNCTLAEWIALGHVLGERGSDPSPDAPLARVVATATSGVLALALLIRGHKCLVSTTCLLVAAVALWGTTRVPWIEDASCDVRVVAPLGAALVAALLCACLFHKVVFLVGGAAFAVVVYMVWNGVRMDRYLTGVGARSILGVTAHLWGALAVAFVVGSVCVYAKAKQTRVLLSSAMGGTLAVVAVVVQDVRVPRWGWMVGCLGGVVVGSTLQCYVVAGRTVRWSRRDRRPGVRGADV